MVRSCSRRPRGRTVAAALAVAAVLSGCGGLAGEDTSASTRSTTASASPSRTSSPEPTPPAPTTGSPSTPPTAASTTTTPAPSTTTTAVTPTATTTPTEAPRTTLQIGDRGPAVLALQERLSGLGYWLGRPDGTFGGLTQQAVFAVQKAAGIGRDGVVGPKTKAALEAGVRPGSRVGGTGVEIDLDRQLLLVVRDGAVTRILNTSTGNGEEYVSDGTTKIARTPTGTFAVYHEVDALEVAELGELYRPKYFYKGWAVHGSTSVPPYPASHGCARVTNAAMDMIWGNGSLMIGTRVVVY